MNNPDNTETRIRPRWTYYNPLLARAPELPQRQWDIIGLLALIGMCISYDLSLFAMTSKQMQATFLIAENQFGKIVSLVGLGAFPAFVLTSLADRLGRRRVLFHSTVIFIIINGCTAFSPNLVVFITLQFLVKMCAFTATMVSAVIISEELDPDYRGWGIGALAALSGCGTGIAIILFAFIDYLPFGWRFIYLAGLLPLLMLGWVFRNLPETRRFHLYHKSGLTGSSLKRAMEPVRGLLRAYPGRLVAVSSIMFILTLAQGASHFFSWKYFQEAHGWKPWQISILLYFGGFSILLTSVFAGRLSDKIGRRRLSIVFIALQSLLLSGFYQVSGWLLPTFWVAATFMGITIGIMVTAFSSELFPTSYRSTASGVIVAAGTAGGILGLWLESVLYNFTGSHWATISYLVLLGLIAALIVALFIPETSRRPLEEIAPEP